MDEDREPERRVVLRPDSEYVIGIATGTVATNRNKDMARVVRQLYKALVRQRRGRVKWAHVKAHSDHKWNDVVDELAVVGTHCGTYGGGAPGSRWARARMDGQLWDMWREGAAWAREGRVRLSLTWSVDGRPLLQVKATKEGKLEWVVPPGDDPTSVTCLQAKDVSEITRVLRTITTDDPFGTLNLLSYYVRF